MRAKFVCLLVLSLSLGWAMPARSSGNGFEASEVQNRPDLEVLRQRLEQAVHRFEAERLERLAADARSDAAVRPGPADRAERFQGRHSRTPVQHRNQLDGRLTARRPDLRPGPASERRRGGDLEAGGAHARIELAGSAMSQISGTVKAEGTGLPIVDVDVVVYDATGEYAGDAFTDAVGVYTVSELEGGSYFVVADASGQNFVTELFDNIPCPGGNCDRTIGTPVVVPDSGTAAGIDFALAVGDSISGTVTVEGSGLPIPGAHIDFYDATGNYAGSANTDESGAYAARGLQGGSYIVAVDASDQGFFVEMFDNIPCPAGDCDLTTGTPVVVPDSGSATGIDFALDVGAEISGTVTAEGSGLPIVDVLISVYEAAGGHVDDAHTDATGAYSVGRLEVGSYVVKAVPTGQIFLAELFDNIPCPLASCDLSTGTPVALGSGENRGGVDFALTRSATISGLVTDETTAAAIANLRIEVRDLSGGPRLASVRTNGDGTYTVTGLMAGTYLVAAVPTGQNYIGEWYDDVACPFFEWFVCESSAAKPVQVAAEGAATGIDFALEPGSVITGTVTDEVTGAPLPNVFVWLLDEGFWNGGYVLNAAVSDGAGRYQLAGLPKGRYFVSTLFLYRLESPRPNYVDEVFPDIPCPLLFCDFSNPLSVAAATTVTGVDLTLVPGAKIQGTVTESATGSPIAGVLVSALYDGWRVERGSTDAAGHYEIVGLPAGRYRVRTSNARGFVDELYDDIPCPRESCPLLPGPSVYLGVGSSVSGVDFGLEADGPVGGSISGRVTDATGALPPFGLRILNLAGGGRRSIAVGIGTYKITNLAPGYYRVLAQGRGSHVDQLYPGIPCPGGGCDLREGAVLAIHDGTALTDIDFALGLGAQIEGTVRGEEDGLPKSGIVVSIYDAHGIFVGQGVSDPAGRYTTGGVPPGTYFARTEALLLDSIDELYFNKPCPFGLCELSSGKPFVVGANDVRGIDFSLTRGARISGRVTAAATGEPTLLSLVRIDDASGRFAAYGYSDLNGEYTTHGGLPPWRYYPRAVGSSAAGFIQQSNPVEGLAVDNSIRGIDFALVGGGAIAGSLTDSVTGLPLDGIPVEVVTSTGEVAARVTSGTLGVYSTPGLPDSSYKVRALGGFGYLGELHVGVSCELRRCDLDAGVSVEIRGANIVTGIDFALDQRRQAARP